MVLPFLFVPGFYLLGSDTGCQAFRYNILITSFKDPEDGVYHITWLSFLRYICLQR
jgi:hypothetical protein